jgi:hypothetical protein
MRDKLNNNPLAQVAVIAVLLILVAFFFMSSMGGKSSSTTTTTSAEVTTPEGSASITATVTTPTTGIPVESAGASAATGAPEVPAPPLPRPITRAFAANRTVVLMIVKKGGVDDRVTVPAVLSSLRGMDGVSVFVAPADQIARYAAITQGVRVDRVPALIVVTPKHLDEGVPSASVSYGFQSPQSVVQAVVDARYRGRTLDYHP